MPLVLNSHSTVIGFIDRTLNRSTRHPWWCRPLRPSAWLLTVCVGVAPALASTIDTRALQLPWRRQHTRHLEIGRADVLWREWASRREGIYAGLHFEMPLDRPTAWKLANDYSDVGTHTPGVTAVRFLERSETRQVIQIDVKVLWKTLTLTFEVEQEPLQTIRFRLVNEAIGEFLGLCTFVDPTTASSSASQESAHTTIELSTRLRPSHPVPMRLVLFAERVALVGGTRSFLKSCESYLRQSSKD